jgi:hypothetical protein
LVHLLDQEDKLIWSFIPKGTYSPKSRYEALLEKENPNPPWWGKVNMETQQSLQKQNSSPGSLKERSPPGKTYKKGGSRT